MKKQRKDREFLFRILSLIFLMTFKRSFQEGSHSVKKVMVFAKKWDHLSKGDQREFGKYLWRSRQAQKILVRTNPGKYPARYSYKG